MNAEQARQKIYSNKLDEILKSIEDAVAAGNFSITFKDTINPELGFVINDRKIDIILQSKIQHDLTNLGYKIYPCFYNVVVQKKVYFGDVLTSTTGFLWWKKTRNLGRDSFNIPQSLSVREIKISWEKI